MTTAAEQERRESSLDRKDDETTSTTEEFFDATEASEEDSFASLSSTELSTSNESHKSKKTKGKKRKKKAKKGSKKKGRKHHKEVSFGTTTVNEFNRSIAAQSVTEKGVPIGIGETLIRSKTVSVSKFEKNRKEWDAELSPEKRRRLLKAEGYSNEDILEANQASMLVRISRKQSVLNMKWDDWDAKKERVARRVKRWSNPINLYRKSARVLSRRSSATTTVAAQ